jgi:hypothetical protein
MKTWFHLISAGLVACFLGGCAVGAGDEGQDGDEGVGQVGEALPVSGGGEGFACGSTTDTCTCTTLADCEDLVNAHICKTPVTCNPKGGCTCVWH